jgi:hypothetical protein
MPRLERFQNKRGQKAGIHRLKVKSAKAPFWLGAALEIRADRRGDFAPDFFRVSGSEDAGRCFPPLSRQ